VSKQLSGFKSDKPLSEPHRIKKYHIYW